MVGRSRGCEGEQAGTLTDRDRGNRVKCGNSLNLGRSGGRALNKRLPLQASSSWLRVMMQVLVPTLPASR